ncbi:hypothetical protein [Parasegetibacter sp. NRK P23]|uniref:hypothetical protein n=1 Tax=Parasegetibacter sp. NRK P23 TaxID=2942999 RepID=UPI002043F27F|nr:hypothetical protein [Parasegetibacter sp. NRK P23]MCM5527931.1 hypothetical protein [Parasegetibacter sp. NRK P23]
MTQDQLTRLLENITLQIAPGKPGQEELLQKAQRAIAASVVKGDIPYSGERFLFSGSDMYARKQAGTETLKQISSISKKILEENKDPETRFFIRSVPVRQYEVAGSIPDWAVGAKPTETLGPFLNQEGREIWIDVYRIEKLVTLYMSGIPVLLFKTTVRGRLVPIGGGTPPLLNEYVLNPGSLWINARLLSPSAPTDKFVGLKIKSGSIKTSILPVLQNNQATLNPASVLTFTLTIDHTQESFPGDGSPYGEDARNATYQLPATLSFVYQNAKVDITGLGAAKCTLYGQAISFTNTTQAAITLEYNAGISKILVPWKADVSTFEVKSCKSNFAQISGSAPIEKTYWGLPVATLEVANPVAAESGGSVILQLGKGLRAKWNGLQYEELRLQQPLLNAEPSMISLLDLKAEAQGARHELVLWQEKEKPASTAELSFLNASPFMLAVSAEQNQEMLTVFCDADIQADRPLKVDSTPFPVRSRASALVLGANKTRRLFYLFDDNLLWDNKKPEDKEPKITWHAIALENAVFTVSPVTGFMLFGELDNTYKKVQRANFFLLFGLQSYLPILPDPYVGDLLRWRRLFAGRTAGTAAGATMMQSMSQVHTTLICTVRYAAGSEGDVVDTDFYFGTPPAHGWLELPAAETDTPTPVPEPVQPAPPVQPAQPDRPFRPVFTGRPVRINPAVLRPAAVTVNPLLKTVKLNTGGRLAQFKNVSKLNVADLIKDKITEHPIGDVFKPLDPEIINKPKENITLQTATSGDVFNGARLRTQKDNSYESFWDDHVIGNRLEADAFSLLDVSSNAHQMGISLNANLLFVKTGNIRGVAEGEQAVTNVNPSFPFVVEGMQVKSPGTLVKSFTLPQMAWEPVINLTPPDRDDPNNPNSPKLAMDPEAGALYFPDDGGATRIWNNSTDLVALAPIPVIDALIKDFKENPKNFTVAAITLPFGLKAISFISKNFVEPVKPDIENLRPLFRSNGDGTYKLEGGIQLKMKAGDFGKPVPTPQEKDEPMFPGYTIQLNNLLTPLGQPSGASNLGHRVSEIFNNEFLIAPIGVPGLENSRGVPVSRMDLTGYGASIFSKWISPTAAMAQTSQARFDVMLGRTGHEVIQVKSILYPWGIRVVRTITVFRTSTGYVYRTDSGWKAESDGLFDFSYRYLKLGVDPYSPPPQPGDFKTENEPFEFHPGVIKGLFNIRNIKDAPSVAEYIAVNNIQGGTTYVNGVKGMEMTAPAAGIEEPVKCGAVYFDADVEIENVVQGHVNKRVVSKKILGYVQVAPAGKPLTANQLRDLMNLHGGVIGGDIDCVIDINNSDQQMKATRFDANVSINENGDPAFVLAVRGQVLLPKDGSWAMVQHNTGTGDVTPLPSNTSVPLIRKGKWKKNVVIDPAVVTGQLLRIAHPLEIIREATNNTINFGYLQTTGTQKALFLTPAYGLGKKMLLSKTPPIFADAYRLMTGNGIFPNIGNAISNFGKAMPLFHGKNPDKSLFEAFTTSNLQDGATNVLELMKVEAVKAGEAVIEQGMSLLQKGANGVLDKAMKFDVPSFEVPLVDTEALRIYIEYKTGGKDVPPADYVDSRLNFDVESFASDMGNQWKSRLNNLAMVVDLGDMDRLMTIKGNFDSKKGKETGYEGGPGDITEGLPTPEIEFSDALQPVIDILQVLASLSSGNYADAMKKGLKIAMGNSGEIWEYKFEATKEIPLVRFPPTDELYNSAQTPLKLEASLALGVYFNAALKVTTDPTQLLPTAGAFLQFKGGLKVMCVSVGVGSIFAIGNVGVKIACDTKVGPSLTLDFGFGIEIVVSLPVVGNASVSYMVGVQMYADKDKVVVAAMMRFRGHASLLGGIVAVTITIEAKGIIVRQNDVTDCSAQVTFAIDISIFLIIDISFSKTWGEDRQIA